MNKVRNLLLTLGHNSSAVLIEDGKIICGYENERLSQVKSDSSFPQLAIMQCLNYKYCDHINTIYISYWNDCFDFDKCINDKHIDQKFLKTLCKQYGAKIQWLSNNFTHHDAHAYAALNFFENHATDEELNLDFHVLVSDGFGNRQEVTTLYHRTNNRLERIGKIYGYENSVGLMYQYATAYCEMKENEDEYKFLGYESHIKEVLSDAQIGKLYDYSTEFIDTYWYNACMKSNNDDCHKTYINVPKLLATKSYWFNEFDKLLNVLGMSKQTDNIENIRCVIGAFIQNNIEQFIGKILKIYKVENIILSGGIFYNVKLNNFIMNNIPGKICVYPLAGDQGCAFGMQRMYEGKFEFNSLLIGKRDLSIATKLDHEMYTDTKLEYYDNRKNFIDRVIELLKTDAIINIITGDMEFGPRALGSTTTLALPTKKNVSYINHLNARNEAMPMAPQILESNARKYFGEQVDRIIGSNFYMIITMDQLQTPDESYMGISHKYPLKDVYSSRCQIIPNNSSQYIKEILESIDSDFIINTSHNRHGTPILYSVYNAISNHFSTAKMDNEQRSYTLIGNF
jgi:carbamoyltransferase